MKKRIYFPNDGKREHFEQNDAKFKDCDLKQAEEIISDINVKYEKINKQEFSEHNEEKFLKDELSLPTPWSKFIQFEMALFNKKLENFHESTVSEWRGLVTILALSKVYKIKISFEEIELEKSKGTLIDVLKKSLKPKFIFEKDESWNKMYIITLDDKFVLGMLSNSTLVCTPYSYDKNLNKKLKKTKCFRNNSFCDPINNMDSDQRKMMYFWLGRIKDELSKINNEEKIKQIFPLINLYRKELSDKLKGTDLNKLNYNIINRNDAVIIDSMRKLMDLYLDTQFISSKNSDLSLYNNESLVLVADKMWDIGKDDEEAENITIIGDVTLAELPDNYVFDSKNKKFVNYEVPEGISIVNTDELLLDKIVIYPVDNYSNELFDTEQEDRKYTCVKKIDSNYYYIIWPINEYLFRFISPSEVQNNIEINIDNDNIEIVLKLKIKAPEFLKSEDEEYKDLYVKKIYTMNKNDGFPGEIKICDEDPVDFPVLAMWPYSEFCLDSNPNENIWKKYITFMGKGKSRNIILEPVYSSDTKWYKKNIKDIYDIEHKIAHSNKLPEYVNFSFISSKRDNKVVGKGIVFLKRPESIILNKNEKWKIAFDFGTSSSTAYYSDDYDKNFIKFGKSYQMSDDNNESNFDDSIFDGVFILNNFFKKNHVFYDNVYRNILPYAYFDKKSYSSMYEKFSNIDKDINEIFYDGHIFFHNSKFKLSTKNRNISKNLKWGNQEDIFTVRKYLKQIFIQCVYRAFSNKVYKIEWLFSYPASLRSYMYKESINKILNDLSKDTGLQDGNANFFTESYATARFFHRKQIEGNQEATDNDLSVCVDIGGGSTDISIWKFKDNKDILHTSFKFASRDIFIDSLFRIKEVFKKLILETLKLKREEFDISNFDKSDNKYMDVIAQIEYELFTNEEKIEDWKNTLENNQHFNYFLDVITLGFSGIIYYISMMVRYLDDKGKIDKNIKTIKIYLSGNGSKLYNWILCYDENIEVKIRDLFENSIDRELFIVFDKDYLKTEAATGLLYCSEDEDIKKINELEEKILSGENFVEIINSEEKQHNINEDLQIFNNSLEETEIIPDENLGKIKEFLNKFNKIFLKNANNKVLRNIDYTYLHGLIRKRIHIIKNKKNLRNLDPIFIMGIDSLIQIMLEEKSKTKK